MRGLIRLLYYLPIERMKQLTVCIDDGLQWEVVYRAEISHTEEDYQELKSDLEFVREENKKLKSDLAETQKIGESWRQECKQLRKENKRLREIQIYWKTVEERIEYDRKVFRE